jgi:type II secretory pathway pseudopilin PulG
MLTRLRHDQRGFLLIEAVVAMALMAIAFALFADFASMLTNRNATLTREAYLSSQARAALDQMSKDIEGAMCNGATQPITNATGTSITFTSPDRQQPYHLRQITYTLANGKLTRQEADSTNTGGPPWTLGAAMPVQIIVDQVGNSTMFHYYKASTTGSGGTDLGTPGTTTNTLRQILNVSMTITATPLASHGTGSMLSQGQSTVMSWLTAPTDSSSLPVCPS